MEETKIPSTCDVVKIYEVLPIISDTPFRITMATVYYKDGEIKRVVNHSKKRININGIYYNPNRAHF